jgi:beta-mannosidase
MVVTDLNGKWEFRQYGRETRPDLRRRRSACVPGCVHTDLLAHKRIADPFAELNELEQRWVDSTDWEYRRYFNVSAAMLREDSRRLVFEGLDTAAAVFLNGTEIGRADNMFRRWVFPVEDVLRLGRNELTVRFRGSVSAARERAKDRPPLPGHAYSWGTGRFRQTDRNYLRKAQYQFGWDWGPHAATCGIWRSVRLECSSTPQLEFVAPQQIWDRDVVRLKVTTHLHAPGVAAGVRGRLCLRLTEPVGPEGRPAAVYVAVTPFRAKAGPFSVTAEITINRPKLWWPAGQGGQPLYLLGAEIRAEDGTVWDRSLKRVGLRKVELINRPDKNGETFFFCVNDRPIFCKGANWIPCDVFPTRVTAETYQRLLRATTDAGMNMLRVWGGGIYENDLFYDLCDQLGVMLWHDHMFACAAYPADEAFLQNVEAEIRDQIRRLKAHPSIVLWCGNNENEQGLADGWLSGKDEKTRKRLFADYLKLTKREEKVTKEEAPDVPWWPSSPSTDGRLTEPNDHRRGDSHFWEVWHKRKPFSRYLEIRPRFNSEFGFQSFPDWETLKPVLGKDRSQWNLTSPVMEQHQRHGAGNAIITEMMCGFFRLPQNLDDFFYVSQLLQGLAIKSGVEHWRRQQPDCMGTLYWQLNDCWPVASWASVDAALRWKALHYFARKFYAPLLISAYEDPHSRQLEAWLTHDAPEACAGQWTLELWSWAGKRLSRMQKNFRIASGASRCVGSWPVAKFAESFDRRAEVFLRFKVNAQDPHGNRLCGENAFHFAPLKRVELPAPKIAVKISGGPEKFIVTLKSNAVAPLTELRTGPLIGVFSDNYLDLYPGETVKLTFTPYKPTASTVLKKTLKIRTLRSTYDI